MPLTAQPPNAVRGQAELSGLTDRDHARLAVGEADTDATLTVSTDKAPTGGGQYVSILGRYRPGAGAYQADLRMMSTGAVSVGITKVIGTTESNVKAAVNSGIAYAPGDTLSVRVQVVGSSPTTIRAKVWKKGTPEPAAWTVSGTDSTPELATPGAFAVCAYLSGSATNGPVVFSFDDVRVEPVTP